MLNYQYMRIHLKDIPNKVVVEYSLLPIADLSGYVYPDISLLDLKIHLNSVISDPKKVPAT